MVAQLRSVILLTNHTDPAVAECSVGQRGPDSDGVPKAHMNMKLRVEHVSVNNILGAAVPHMIIITSNQPCSTDPFYAGARRINNVIAVHFSATQKTIMNERFTIDDTCDSDEIKILLLNADGVNIDAPLKSVNIVLEVHHMFDDEIAICDTFSAMINDISGREDLSADEVNNHVKFMAYAIREINECGIPKEKTKKYYLGEMERIFVACQPAADPVDSDDPVESDDSDAP